MALIYYLIIKFDEHWVRVKESAHFTANLKLEQLPSNHIQ